MGRGERKGEDLWGRGAGGLIEDSFFFLIFFALCYFFFFSISEDVSGMGWLRFCFCQMLFGGWIYFRKANHWESILWLWGVEHYIRLRRG